MKLKPGDSLWTTMPNKAYVVMMSEISKDEELGYLSKNQANHLRKVAYRLREKGKRSAK